MSRPALYSILEFRGQRFVLLEVDETNDVAGVAPWKWSPLDSTAREFAPDMHATQWVSLSRLGEFRPVGRALAI